MPLSDSPTRFQLRSMVRRELLDSYGQWWTDAELNVYLDQWLQDMQEEFEFVWTTSTSTAVSTATFSIGDDMHRPDTAYWNDVRLAGMSIEQLNELNPSNDWRNAEPGEPRAVWQPSPEVFVLWPAPATPGTLILEYPKLLTFDADDSVCELPSWTKYSAINYVCARALMRVGPNQNLRSADRRWKKFKRQQALFSDVYQNYFPSTYWSLRPGGRYEASLATTWRT